jgi:hypothetical protein
VREAYEIYGKFLEIRDYYLEPPAQQLQAMSELFGEKHWDCTEIWRRLYIKNDELQTSQAAEPKQWKPPGWLARIVGAFGLEKVVDGIPYTWDAHLMDSHPFWRTLGKW